MELNLVLSWTTRTAPPLVVDNWHGPRWIEMVTGEVDHPAWGVEIGHASADGQGAILVRTVEPGEFARFNSAADRSQRVLLGEFGMFELLNRTLPAFTDHRQRAYQVALPIFARQEAGQMFLWSRLQWQVDGVARQVHFYRFAGAWLGACEDPPFYAIGDGYDPNGLLLSRGITAELGDELKRGVDLKWLDRHPYRKPHTAGFPLPRPVQEDHYAVFEGDEGRAGITRIPRT